MRALVIELGAEAEAVSSKRQWKSDDVIGVDEIVRRRAEVELGKDAADHIQLNAFAWIRATDAKQAERIADAHRGDRRILAARIVERAERSVKVADELSGFFRVGDQRTEDLIFGKGHRAGGFRLVNARTASRCIGGLRARGNGDRHKHDHQRHHTGTPMPIRHGATPSGEECAYCNPAKAL